MLINITLGKGFEPLRRISISSFRGYRRSPGLATPATDILCKKLNQTLFYIPIDSSEDKGKTL